MTGRAWLRRSRAIFGEGARQAQRLERLISRTTGCGSVTAPGSTSPGSAKYGQLSSALTTSVRSRSRWAICSGLGCWEKAALPWIASLHDLEVISKVIERPAEFLLYLRRRADSGVATYYRGADELDLFMLFLDGGLYVEPDPEEVRLQHPAAGPPGPTPGSSTSGTRARPSSAPTPIRWTPGCTGSRARVPTRSTKPAFNTHPAAQQIVDFLADGRKPGWFRFGADLLGLAGTAQKKLGDSLREMAAKTGQTADGTAWSALRRHVGLSDRSSPARSRAP